MQALASGAALVRADLATGPVDVSGIARKRPKNAPIS
jgi:hypothetical protein